MVRGMKNPVATAALCALLATSLPAAFALTEAAKPAPAPGEIVNAAPEADWVAIAPDDLLVMTLAPDPRGGAGRTGERRIVIQLMPAPFSQGWVSNIRKLAAAHWWDGLSINRVQDNYVVQWGDAGGGDKLKARPLPAGLVAVPERDYTVSADAYRRGAKVSRKNWANRSYPPIGHDDPYAGRTTYWRGFPFASASASDGPAWPIHCYGMVGVGRNLSPDTGSGAELYTVIGHAPRHLDRNIALVGRVIEGIEHLSSLPRGTGPLGFYEHPQERTPIISVRLASELPKAEQPRFTYLSTESDSFARYADARANRRDPFFVTPAGGADICNIPVPVRRVPG